MGKFVQAFYNKMMGTFEFPYNVFIKHQEELENEFPKEKGWRSTSFMGQIIVYHEERF
jgi:hypothetical protein